MNVPFEGTKKGRFYFLNRDNQGPIFSMEMSGRDVTSFPTKKGPTFWGRTAS
jgi:hypothetical protein